MTLDNIRAKACCACSLLIWIIVGQGPAVLAAGADGVLGRFYLSC